MTLALRMSPNGIAPQDGWDGSARDSTWTDDTEAQTIRRAIGQGWSCRHCGHRWTCGCSWGYCRPVRSWMSRFSPGGASVSSVNVGPAKMSSSSVDSYACFSRQAAFFSGEQPQWAESGLPPQLPDKRLPWKMTPRAMTPIRVANPRTETISVVSTVADLAAPASNATGRPHFVTISRGNCDDCQKNVAVSFEQSSPTGVRSPGSFSILYRGVTQNSLTRRWGVGPSNRYVEATRHSRTSPRRLVLGRPSTQ